MTPLALELKNAIETALPGSEAVVNDPDGAHLSAEVVAPQFTGLSRLAQHKLVYAALGDAMRERVHALQLITRTI
jgi:stress-induced morphogen